MEWEEFKEGLFTQFRANQFYDPSGELTKLQQGGSVKEYQVQFESLLSKIGPLPQNQQVSCFISGLKEVIKSNVMVGKPFTLTSAIRLA